MSNINQSIVLIGGGGGVYRVCRFLKNIRPNITTIQTVFDHGGHSGELRDERGILPPGDIRQAILALSENYSEPSLRKLMSFRFKDVGISSLNGSTVGNILLSALVEIEGNLPDAIRGLCRLCGVRGKVLPVSLDDAELCVELSDGSVLVGEGRIDTRSIEDERTIKQAFLRPNAHLFVDAYDAIVCADKVVLCPGDIFTSLVPNLLVDGFAEALAKTAAKVIYVVNIMTKKAETDGYTASDFVRTVCSYTRRKIDHVVYNNSELSPQCVESYEKEKSRPVVFTSADCALASDWIGAPLVDETGDIVRHHERIASIIADL